MISTEVQGAVDVITIKCPLTSEHTEAFGSAVTTAAAGAIPQIVVDLSSVAMVDSKGLESLLAARQVVRGRSGVMKLASPISLVADALHATGVGELFERYDNVRSAVGSFSR